MRLPGNRKNVGIPTSARGEAAHHSVGTKAGGGAQQVGAYVGRGGDEGVRTTDMGINQSQRFSKSRPCPVCGGYDQAVRGQGVRCFGFISDDGQWAHCTRPEHAGGLPFNESPNAYAHRLQGECKCGTEHGPAMTTPKGSKSLAPKGKSVATYDYLGADGTLLYQTVRYEPKGFSQRRPDGKGGWVWNLNGITPVLYRLPELLAADPTARRYVTEGEKDAKNGAELSLVTTCNPMGAGKWRAEYSESLRGRHVVVIADKDTAGRSHAQQVAASLYSKAVSVKVIECPGESSKDLSDFIAQGHGRADVEALADAAPEWTPPVQAVAPPISDVLNEVVTYLGRYMVMDRHQRDAIALWTAHTWALDAADNTPYLAISSAEMRSGKTRLLEVLSYLVARPWFTGHVSAAVLIRKIERDHPTLLLDESDAAFKGNGEYVEALRGILNSGYQRGGVASLCVGKGFELKDFNLFGPKALAGIGGLPGTVKDRAIPIELHRRRLNEPVERLRRREAQEQTAMLGERLERWAASAIHTLTEARPTIPDELNDRAADVWEPLLAIADLAGGEWPQRARKAALALSAGAGRDDNSLGVQLLEDIRRVFQGQYTERIASVDLVGALNGMEESPWGDLNGKALTPLGLARMLRPFGVKPKQVRVDESTNCKGYEAVQFTDVWARYVPRISETTETRETESDSEASNVSDVSVVSLSGGMVADDREVIEV